MKILYRIVIMIGFGIAGFMLGALFAGRSGAAEGSGLAGGAIVLGYGLGVAVVAMIAGLMVSLRLSDAALLRTAVCVGAPLGLFVVYSTVRFRSLQQSRLDPPEAYADIPVFFLQLDPGRTVSPIRYCRDRSLSTALAGAGLRNCLMAGHVRPMHLPRRCVTCLLRWIPCSKWMVVRNHAVAKSCNA